MVISTTVSSNIEATAEYMEDPKQMLARNDANRLYRIKTKITLAYKGTSSDVSFKDVQVHLQLPPGVWAEKTLFKFENINFGGRPKTPPVVQLYLYPTNKVSPTENKVAISATY
jgi:hypothetical protein